MIECERSDDGGEEQFGPLRPQPQMRSDAESSVGVAGNGCVEQARCGRQAEWSVLLHGLCAATIALATIRFLSLFTTLAVCLVGVCVLSPALRMLSCSPFRFSGPFGCGSAKANVIDHDGCPGNSGPSVPQRRPLPPPATPLSLVKRGLRLLMRVMLSVPRSFRWKRFGRSTRRCRDTASRANITTVTACSTTTNTVEMVTGSRAGKDYVHRSQRQHLVCTTREQR